MKNLITKIIVVLLLGGWGGAAQASLIFDFEFTDGTHTIKGEILGLIDNSTGSASEVRLTGNTAYPEVLDPANGSFIILNFYSNQFTVSNSVIIDADFFMDVAFIDNASLVSALSIALGVSEGDYAQYRSQNSPFDLSVQGPITLTRRSSIPEPQTAILVILGLAGLGFSRYKKQH